MKKNIVKLIVIGGFYSSLNRYGNLASNFPNKINIQLKVSKNNFCLKTGWTLKLESFKIRLNKMLKFIGGW